MIICWYVDTYLLKFYDKTHILLFLFNLQVLPAWNATKNKLLLNFSNNYYLYEKKNDRNESFF